MKETTSVLALITGLALVATGNCIGLIGLIPTAILLTVSVKKV
jgi:hypothetical protein